ncbi:ABC transporter substrate-binding protein [Caldicellulosiruptoraceae bacterium PP1]
MQRSKKLTRLVALAVAVIFLVSLAMSFAIAGEKMTRKNTLYVAGFQWGPPTNFNPFNTSPAWPIGSNSYIYETLFSFNLITGNLDPLIGEKYQWKDSLTLVITLRKGTKWQDGKPLTAKDVEYTINLGKKVAVSYSPIWDYITSCKALNDLTIEMKLNPKKAHKAMVENYISTIRIVPKHVWEPIEKKNAVTQAVNLKPVGSGPYKLLSYNQSQIVLVRDDNYWGIKYFGKPAPTYIVHPIFKSNDAGNLALEKGQIDLSQQFCPQIWKMWEDKKLPVGTWYKNVPYHVPASIPSLIINVNKKPLNNPLVRRALAYSINYAKIAETAMSRYSQPVSSSLIIPVGVPEKKFYNKADVEKYGWKYDPKKAVEILEKELKAKKGSDGVYVLPDGTRLGPITLECPYGWTDWMTSLEVVAESAKKVGFDIRTSYPEFPVVADHRDNGNFDILMWTPGGGYSPAHPWIRFRDVMESRGVPPAGQVAYWNWGRYKNAQAEKLLDQAASTQDTKKLTEIYRQLNILYMKDIPIIPLEYRPWEFYEYNETYWTNFPNEKNPTAPPQHNYAGVQLLYKIKPKK